MFECGVGEIISLNKVADISWAIPYYFDRPQKADTFYESPPFRHFGSDWCLRIYPNGERANHSVEFVGLYVVQLQSDDDLPGMGFCPEEVDFEIGILGLDYDLKGKICGSQLYGYGTDFVGGPTCIRRRYLLNNQYMFAPAGCLIIRYIAKPVHHSIHVESQTEILEGISALSRDFQSLLNSEQKSDVTFKVKNRVFRAHRLILQARSNVFAAMFEHNMRENNTGIVKIEDCHPDIFQDFLSFIYTGKIDNLHSGNVMGLYALANKYDVSNLMEITLNFMKENLDLDIVCDVIAVAEKFNETELKNTARKLLLDNIQVVMSSDKWIHFIRENPELATEILADRMSKVVHFNDPVVENQRHSDSVFIC